MTNKLCLLWQNVMTRQWYHIGYLILKDSGMYVFKYDETEKHRGLKEALLNGYRLHPTFPEIGKEYESKFLFSAFLRRLPDRNRKDYAPIFTELGITQDSSDFDLLTITGGKLNSDSYEFVKPIQFNDNEFSLEFYLRGWRHYNDSSDALVNGDELRLEVDADNQHDPNAVKVVKNETKVIGFVPAFYSEFLREVIENQLPYTVVDCEYDENAPSLFKVKIKMSGNIDEALLKKYERDVFVTI